MKQLTKTQEMDNAYKAVQSDKSLTDHQKAVEWRLITLQDHIETMRDGNSMSAQNSSDLRMLCTCVSEIADFLRELNRERTE